MRDFWAKVKRGAADICWPWLGFKKPSGHGLTSYKSMPTHASRKAWILTNGYPPNDLCVLHRCDNAACCNPAHLYLGTRADNMFDMFGNIPSHARGLTGRKYMLTDEQIEKLFQRRREGATLKQCAEEFNIHHSTVWRYVTARRRAKLDKLRSDRLSVAHK